jgi:hypothetical protein
MAAAVGAAISVNLELVVELGVKSGGRWAVTSPNVPGRPGWILCRLDLVQPLYPGGFYEVRWFRLDRGKFVEITREKFQLKNHAFGTPR